MISKPSELLRSAHQAIRTGRSQDAIDSLRPLAGSPGPDQDEAILLTGRAWFSLGHHHEAKSAFVRVLRSKQAAGVLRIRARYHLGTALMHAGDYRRSERQVMRALGWLRSHADGANLEPGLLSTLGGLHRRRGAIGSSIRIHEGAVALARSRRVPNWGVFALNLVHALLGAGEHQRVLGILREVDADAESVSPAQRSAVVLARVQALMGLGELDTAEQLMLEARPEFERLERAHLFLAMELQADILIRRARFADALAILSAPDAEAAESMTLYPVRSGLRVRVAEALLGLGRVDEALAAAQSAVRFGQTSDAFDTARALRTAAECLERQGRLDVARSTVVEAHLVLGAMEIVEEREPLARLATRLGVELPPIGQQSLDRPPSGHHSSSPNWLTLSDGRTFLVQDERLHATLRRSATDLLPVLIEGETGTGKELVAHLIHDLGPRRSRPFVIVDCAALPLGLIESELFGSARGAFTGAVADRAGLIASADGGTLFLDELTELPPSLQSRLLRVIQEGTYRRVGEDRPRKVDVRIVAATNRDIDHAVRSGTLKHDLFHRLNGHRVRLLPLRARAHEIALLADHFAHAAGCLGVGRSGHAKLAAHGWSGNARELEMVIRLAASSLAAGAWIDAEALAAIGFRPEAGSPHGTLRTSRREAERQSIELALEQSGGNLSAAARSLGISRQSLYEAMRRVGVTRPQ